LGGGDIERGSGVREREGESASGGIPGPGYIHTYIGVHTQIHWVHTHIHWGTYTHTWVHTHIHLVHTHIHLVHTHTYLKLAQTGR
jgi:hypothetical protein